MSLRCINQHLPEQFRRVISSNFVILLTGCSRDWPFSVARESEKAGLTTFNFKPLSQSRLRVAGARYSSCSFPQSRRGSGAGCSGVVCNFGAQDIHPGDRISSSSSQSGGFGELRVARHYSSSRVSTIGLKKEEAVMKKGATVWKEKKRVRSVSTAPEMSRADAETPAKAVRDKKDGSLSAADPTGRPTTTAKDSRKASAAAAVAKVDQEVAAPVETSSQTVDVDTMLLRFLVGKGGSTKEKIQKDCGVKLKVPSTHEAKASKSGCSVVITGSEAGIEAAQKQIKAILDEAVQSKLQYTHFISLPLATHPDLLEQVEKFQETILARNQQTSQISSSGGESSVSEEEKVDPMDTDKAVSASEEEVKSPKADNLDKEKEKGVTEDEGESPKAVVVLTEEKVREEEVKVPKADKKIDGMDTAKVVPAEKLQDPKADIMDLETGVLEEEKISTEEVMDMEKGVIEEAKTAGASNKSGIDKSIFVKPRTFHLTVLMLKLWNEERVQRAAEVLEKTMASVHEALEARPVVLDIKGVETMKGKPEKAHVLFARVQDSAEKTRLMKACQALIDAYVESGLVMEKDIGQNLKLHATLMNTTHRTVKKNLRFGKRIPFDATEILEQYGEWKWGEYGIQEAHLSQRFVYGDNGYYHCVKSILLPAEAP